MFKSKMTPLTSSGFIIISALFIAAFANQTFFAKALQSYPLINWQNGLFLISLFFFLTAILILLLSAFCHLRLFKPVLILFLLISAVGAYFSDQYGIIIDRSMLYSAADTDPGEVRDLLSYKLLIYLLMLWALPAFLIIKTNLTRPSLLQETTTRLKLAFASLAVVIAIFVTLWPNYASFFREHKTIVSHANPVFGFFSLGQNIYKAVVLAPMKHKIIALHAEHNDPHPERELIIMVVGETARADHFSLNGYQRETNPELKKRNVINFPHVTSCGTLTIDSVPCMFSKLDRENFTQRKAKHQDNVLDILDRVGVNILWRDNNSSSKGVADRITYQNFKTAELNPACDNECRDIGMLHGLNDYINAHKDGDILIILHQMGNHGPAYYKRYPKSFEKFRPVCKTNELSNCTSQEIINAYDNAILYTDDFLARVIDFLKPYDKDFETAMIYMSDHGESLGENGVYLHGLPYLLAPEAQKHVPAIMWFGKNFDKDILADMKQRQKQNWSHDNLFHTLLGLYEIEADVYNPAMNILAAPHQVEKPALKEQAEINTGKQKPSANF